MVRTNKKGSGASQGKRSAGRKASRPTSSPQKSGTSPTKAQTEISDRAIKQRFTGLRSSDGCGAVVAVAEQAGKQWEIVKGGVEINTAIGGGGAKSGIKRAANGLFRASEAFAALGHPQRLRILVKLLGSPGTYQTLMTLTKLGAGPLYHHINQLRMAGLILPKQRDLYELTRGGRNVILTALALEPLMRDKRRRPLVGESK